MRSRSLFTRVIVLFAAATPVVVKAQVQLSAAIGDRVLTDSVDGVIWARGRDYKASFSEKGATFVPYLGPTAPRNFPVTFAIDGITSGANGLPVVRSEPAELRGREVSIDRGSALEIYELDSGGVEQLFRFRQPAGEGDLVVRLAVETELAMAPDDGGGIVFSNDLGGVRCTKAEVLDASGRRADVETRIAGNSIEIVVPASFLEGATYPVTLDPWIQAFAFALSPIGSATTPDWFQNPDTAYEVSTGRYLVTYEQAYSATDHDVYVIPYTSGQSPPPSGPLAQIDFTTSNWTKPKIASNGLNAGFLVVAEQTLSGGAIVIGGRTVDGATLALSAQFQISSGEVGQKSNPDVGGDPSGYYCVTWQNTPPASQSHVYFRLVTETGALLPSSVLGIVSGLYNDSVPSISKSNRNSSSLYQDWMIVFQRTAGASNEDVWGSLIHWTGAVLDDGFAIDTSPLSHTKPQVSTQADYGLGLRRFVVIYQQFTGGGPFGSPDEDLVARVMDGSTPVASPVNVTNLLGAPANDDQLDPCIDSDGTRFAIGYTEKGSPFAAEQGIPYLATLHLVGLTTLGVTELPTSTNAYAGADELLQIASAYGGGGAAYEYLQVCQVTALWSPTVVGIHGAVYEGWSAAAAGGWFNYALPGCGTLTLTMSGFPALGSLVGASLSGIEGTPYLIIGTSIPPLALCTGCLLGIDPLSATIIQTDSLYGVVPPEGGLVNSNIAVQGADLGSTSGCSGSPSFSLSEEVIITIL